MLPYQLTIDGSTQNVVCYDFFDDVSDGDTWQANILNVGEASASGFFGGSDATAQYERVAWLSTQTWTDSAEQIGLQYAIWNAFDPGSTTSAGALQYEQEADAAVRLAARSRGGIGEAARSRARVVGGARRAGGVSGARRAGASRWRLRRDC